MSISLLRIYLSTMILLAFGLSELHAQTMFILKENGALSSQNISTIKNIVFSETGIVLQKTDGKSDLFTDSIIRYLNFENLKTISSDAGKDMVVKEGEKVTLDAMASSGPFDDALMFNWYASGGIQLSSATVSKPTFTAPEVKQDTTYVFSLLVSDGRNIAPMDSVCIKVLNVNKAPAVVSSLNLKVTQSEYFEDTIAGLDADNDSISFRLDNVPAFVKIRRISNNRYVVYGTFPDSFYGKMAYDLTCTDGQSTVLYKLNFDVTGVNSVPSQMEVSHITDSRCVYPSVVSDAVNIDNNGNQFRSYRLYDDQGTLLKTDVLSVGLNKLTVPAIHPGLLLLDLQGDAQHLEVKLMKK